MELDLTEVHSFTVLAREGHFGHAAEVLHVSASGLTKRIQRLEHRLGTRLVDRGPAGVASFTPAGRRFAQRGERLLDQAHHTVAAARRASATVVVGTPGGDGAHILECWTERQPLSVRRVFDELVFNVGLPFGELDSALLSHRVDVLITAGPTSQPAVVANRLWPMTRVGLVAVSHPLAASKRVRVEDFATWPMLRDVAAPPSWMDLWCLGDVRPIEEARLVEIAPRSMRDVMDRIALGHEVTVTQRLLSIRPPARLAYVELAHAPATWYFAHTRRGEQREAVRQVVRALLESGRATAE